MKTRELLSIEWMVRIIGARHMAHDQAERDALKAVRLGDQHVQLVLRQAEPGHPRVHVQARGPRLLASARGLRPRLDLFKGIEHGDQPTLPHDIDESRIRAVKNIDRGTAGRPWRGCENLSRGDAFIDRGDEKGPATGACQRQDHARGTGTVSIGFDRGSTVRRRGAIPQQSPVGDNRVKVDRQNGCGVARLPLRHVSLKARLALFQIPEARELFFKEQLDFADWAVALFSNDDFRLVMYFVTTFLPSPVPIKELIQ